MRVETREKDYLFIEKNFMVDCTEINEWQMEHAYWWNMMDNCMIERHHPTQQILHDIISPTHRERSMRRWTIGRKIEQKARRPKKRKRSAQFLIMRDLQHDLFTCSVHLNAKTFDIIQGLHSKKGLHSPRGALKSRRPWGVGCFSCYEDKRYDMYKRWRHS